VVVLHEWSLHHLVLHETLERGDPGAYLGEMRRAYGELGSFVGRQVVRGLGGSLFPSLLPLNERLPESSLAAVTLTEALRPAVARRMSGRPVLALPLHFSSPLDPAPSREEARRVLGLPPGAFVICAPGLGTAAKRLDLAIEAAARMERGRAGVLLVVAGELDSSLALPDRARELGFAAGLRVTGRLSLEDFTRHLCAADVVLALRFPSYGEMSAALVRALGLGRPAFVTAGTPAALELPEGVGIPISPGAGEEDELLAFLLRLRDDQALGERLGEVSRDFVRARHDLPRTVDRLATFLDEVADRVEGLLANLPPGPEEVGTLPAYLKEELHWAARDLGVGGLAREVDSLVDELCGRPQGL
jgi:glycosyltransferase involved in cell wall biosynthesis